MSTAVFGNAGNVTCPLLYMEGELAAVIQPDTELSFNKAKV
jgi:hypothetical protein